MQIHDLVAWPAHLRMLEAARDRGLRDTGGAYSSGTAQRAGEVVRFPAQLASAPIYENAVSRELACANIGASSPRSSPSSLPSQARSSTMTPAATSLLGLVMKT
jgi:hypothetical protein